MASARRTARGIAGFLFGFASTVLLVAIWGRAVVVDTDELAASLAPMAASEAVVDRFTTWMVDELGEVGLDPVTAEAASDHVLESPEVSSALSGLVAEGVEAAASTDPEGSSVDPAAAFAPAVPGITASLNEVGVPASEDQVSAAVAGLDPIVVRQPQEEPLVGPDSDAASRLGTAAVLGLAAMLIAGTAYAAVSLDRREAIRSLLSRFALGALSFALFLRIGSWILDPGGGRAPLMESLGLIAVSKWLVPLAIGLAAGCGAAVFWLVRRRRRLTPEAATHSPSAVPTPRGR
jgi:hypothetical protein